MNYRIIYKDELYHHGVKGMKWGVRRFQNPDGTRAGSAKQTRGEKRKETVRNNVNKWEESRKSYNESVGKYWDYVNSHGGYKGARSRVSRKASKIANNKAMYKQSNKSRRQLEKSFKKLKVEDIDNEMIAIGEKYALKNAALTTTRKDGQVGPGVKLVAKSFKVNEKTERAKASVASKFGMNKSAQTHRNNADYYKKTSEDLASGKVGKPKTNYQKAMRWLGKTEFATHAIKNSSDLSPQMKAQALAEQRLLRSADGWYKKRAKRYAATKVVDIVLSTRNRG